MCIYLFKPQEAVSYPCVFVKAIVNCLECWVESDVVTRIEYCIDYLKKALEWIGCLILGLEPS